MLQSKRVRTALVLVIAIGLLAVWWSFSERRTSLSRQVAEILGDQTAQRITNFEYLERRDGRVLFRLLAESNIEDRTGTSELSKVWLEHYDPEGRLIETVQGQAARYDRSTEQVLFRDEVVVELVDGTRVKARALRANLGTGIIRIEDEFELERGKLRGRGRGMLYRTASRLLEVDRLDGLRLPVPGGVADANSRRMTYHLSEGVFRFLEQAAIRGPERGLSGDLIVLTMTPLQTLETVEATGSARLLVGPNRSFEGQRIQLFFDSAANRLTHFDVTGNPAAESLSDIRQATFLQQSAGGGHRLESDRMEGRSDPSGSSLRELEAVGAVSLRSADLGIEDGQAARLLATFASEQATVESIRMEGGVELVRRVADGSRSERLRSRELDIELESDSSLKRLTAHREVTLETVEEALNRDLTARDRLDLGYRDGLLESAEASGEAVLEVRRSDGRDVIRSPHLEAAFERGLLQRVVAGPGVEVEVDEAEATRRTRSRDLEAAYADGQLQSVVQRGDVRLWESAGGSVVEIRSQLARLAPDGLISASGGRVLVRSGEAAAAESQETLADQVVLDRSTGTMVATGRVESVSREGAEPAIVTAEKMELNRGAGRARYSGSPRLVQGPTTVRGKSLVVSRRELVVEGEVRSELIEEGPEGPVRYDIEAERMLYLPGDGLITYTGEVVVNSADLSVAAPRVKLFFDSEHQEIERIVASGGATVLEQGRRWTGETVTYLPASSKVTIGN